MNALFISSTYDLNELSDARNHGIQFHRLNRLLTSHFLYLNKPTFNN